MEGGRVGLRTEGGGEGVIHITGILFENLPKSGREADLKNI